MKIPCVLFLCSIIVVNLSGQNPAIFFSEYDEGNSNNKALEIYNPGPGNVPLDEYAIGIAFDNGEWGNYFRFPQGRILEVNNTHVLVNAQVDPTLYDPSKAGTVLTGTSVVSFNGNDAVGLFHITASDTILVDVVGFPGSATGLGWDVAGTTDGTRNHTLIRKPYIEHGNTVWDLSKGTTADDSEWIIKSVDDFTNLGTHFFQPLTLVSDINLMAAGGNPGINTDGGTLQINVEIMPEDATLKNLDWTSSDQLLASVDENGQVKAFNNGAVTISASATDGSGVSGSIVITITNQSGLIPVSSITITAEGDADTIRVNQASLQMYAGVEPAAANNKDVTWDTNNHDIATIDNNGMLTPLKNGKVSVTAGAVDGSGVTGSKVIVITGQFREIPDIASLRQTTPGDGTVYKITGEVFVSQSIFYNNQKFIQDNHGAIEVDDPDGRIKTTYTIGDGITGLTGYMEDYYGMLQLHPVEDPGIPTTKNSRLTPDSISLYQLNHDFGSWESRLVKIDHLYFTDAGKMFEDGKAYIVYSGQDSGLFRTQFFDADYIGTVIPYSADVTGIAIEFNGTAQLSARYLSDIARIEAEGLHGVKPDKYLRIWPNPAADFLNIRYEGAGAELQITSVTGKIILNINMTNNTSKIDISSLHPGIYFVVLTAGKMARVERFAKY